MAPFKSGKGRNLGKLVKGYKSSNIGQGLGSGGSSTPVGFTATGGTEYTLADPGSPTGYYKYHAFTNPGILTTTAGANTAESLDFLAIGGGGGGGYINPRSPSPYQAAGGGGAGGYIAHDQSTIVIATGTYTVAIGTAGLGSPDGTPGHPGSSGGDTTITPPSSPTTYVYRAYGGGGGGGGPSSDREGLPGGSGGGGGSPTIVTNTAETSAGTGIPGQGYAGRPGSSVRGYAAPSPENGRTSGGGGGAGGLGSNPGSERFWGPSPSAPAADAPYCAGGTGGPGVTNPVFVSPKLASSGLPGGQITAVGPTGLYGGGGGGSSVSNPVSLGGKGGAGGGGHGSNPSNYAAPIQSATPSPMQPRIAPGPYPSDPVGQPFSHATGVGCGGGGSHSPGYGGGNGTKGFLILRYETPAPS